jgi:16S rRNA (guanine966-N2)-methyltransferase
VGELRIIAGRQRGHRIQVPRGEVRPTAERVREAVFAALDSLDAVSGSRVLDLFAGSGALGLEALSRGAAHCSFVESDRRVVGVLRANIRALGLGAEATVMAMPYQKALKLVAGIDPGYDVLFVDPPYRMLEAVTGTLTGFLPVIMRPGGIVVIEGPRHAVVEVGMPATFVRHYGDTSITMVEIGAEHP